MSIDDDFYYKEVPVDGCPGWTIQIAKRLNGLAVTLSDKNGSVVLEFDPEFNNDTLEVCIDAPHDGIIYKHIPAMAFIEFCDVSRMEMLKCLKPTR